LDVVNNLLVCLLQRWIRLYPRFGKSYKFKLLKNHVKLALRSGIYALTTVPNRHYVWFHLEHNWFQRL